MKIHPSGGIYTCDARIAQTELRNKQPKKDLHTKNYKMLLKETEEDTYENI